MVLCSGSSTNDFWFAARIKESLAECFSIYQLILGFLWLAEVKILTLSTRSSCCQSTAPLPVCSYCYYTPLQHTKWPHRSVMAIVLDQLAINEQCKVKLNLEFYFNPFMTTPHICAEAKGWALTPAHRANVSLDGWCLCSESTPSAQRPSWRRRLSVQGRGGQLVGQGSDHVTILRVITWFSILPAAGLSELFQGMPGWAERC